MSSEVQQTSLSHSSAPGRDSSILSAISDSVASATVPLAPAPATKCGNRSTLRRSRPREPTAGGCSDATQQQAIHLYYPSMSRIYDETVGRAFTGWYGHMMSRIDARGLGEVRRQLL